MNKEKVKEALKKLKESSNKRNFKQTVDLIINLKELDLKKPENQIDLFIALHYPTGKKISVCALVGAELFEGAKTKCDFAVLSDDFPAYEGDKKKIKKLAETYDFFIAQANIMPKIAQVFGKVFGPKQKMPNPKAGCVVPPNANLTPLVEKLQKTVRVKAKTGLHIQCIVGKEDQDENEVVENILAIYNAIIHKLPQEENSIKNVLIKLCMSKPIAISNK